MVHSGMNTIADNKSSGTMKENWKDLGIKDKIQYICAVTLIGSGILIAFLCAIFNFWEITTGVLIYIAQAFITAGGIFGVSIYFKTKLGEFESKRKNELRGLIDEVSEKIERRYETNIGKKLE